ncbi:MAG: hypothetical protein ACW96X_08110 [Promethearchaeota archaeon]|jgi:hypothetical protein
MKKKAKRRKLFRRSHRYNIYSLPGVIIRERGLIDRGLRRKGNKREPEDLGLENSKKKKEKERLSDTIPRQPTNISRIITARQRQLSDKGLRSGDDLRYLENLDLEGDGDFTLPDLSFNVKSRKQKEIEGIGEIYRKYNELKFTQSKVFEPRLCRKVLQFRNARSFMRVGGFLIGLSIILPFLIKRAYGLSISPLFLGLICFLYGVKGFTQNNSDPNRLRDTFIIYCGCLMIIIGVIFLLYASEAFFLCNGYVICPVSPGLAVGTGIVLIILVIIFIRFGINRIKLKSLIELASNSK